MEPEEAALNHVIDGRCSVRERDPGGRCPGWAAMSIAVVSLPLVTITLLAMAIWTGGLVAIFVVARAASKTLETGQRIEFFRALGRSYGVVGMLALLVALVTGAILLRQHPWNSVQVAAAIVAGALLAATVAGMLQARAMTRLRRRALAQGPTHGRRAPPRRSARRRAARRDRPSHPCAHRARRRARPLMIHTITGHSR